MIIQETAMVRAHYRTREYYTSKGYNVPQKQRELFEVKVKDLNPKCSTKVECVCDYCGKHFFRMFCKIDMNAKKISCNNCSSKKRQDYYLEHYGVKYQFQIPEVIQKIKKTQSEHLKSQEYRENLWNKRKKTFAKNHNGFETPFHNPDTVKKAQDTRKKLYGHESYFGVSSSEERYQYKLKCAETRYKNSTTSTSQEQEYLHSILGGELNKNVDVYNPDIVLENEKIVIEYDGFGHFFYDEYFERDSTEHELHRESVIQSYGYKIIRFVCKDDKLPESNVILKIFDFCKKVNTKKLVVDFVDKNIIYDNTQITFDEVLNEKGEN